MYASLCVATAVAVAVLLVGEGRGRPALAWLAKPTASACFVAAALVLGATRSGHGRVLLAGLALAALGDLLLLARGSRRAFVAGLGAFLLGHLAYAAAFVVRGVSPLPALVATPPTALAGAAALRWLWPHLERAMRAPVMLYVLAIVAMVCLAWGTRDPTTIGGAIAFFCSDLAVARDRFVRRSLANRLWGLPLYYAGQLALAATVTAAT